MKTLLLAYFGLVANMVGQSTPLPTDVNEGLQVNRGGQINEFDLSWWGDDGWTYFIKHSTDLVNWDYVAVIKEGEDDVINWNFSLDLPAHFFRLYKSNEPTNGDAELADFDYDQLGNMVELEHGLDPLDPSDALSDNDSDGYTNREEILAGTDLNDEGLYPVGLPASIARIVSGNHQICDLNQFVESPLVLEVREGLHGPPIANTEVTFTLVGNAELAPVKNNAQLSGTSLSVYTDANGRASVYFKTTSQATGTVKVTGVVDAVFAVVFQATVNSATTAPTAPADIEAEWVNPSQVAIEWAPSAGTSYYLLERQNAQGQWETVAQIAGNQSSYMDSTASYGVHKSYRITARNVIGTSQITQTESEGGDEEDGDISSPNIDSQPHGDWDKDGLTNEREIVLGTSRKMADTDRDGIIDSRDGAPTDPDYTFTATPEEAYTVVKLSDLGAQSGDQPTTINDLGDIILANPSGSFLLRDGQRIAAPEGLFVRGINNLGKVVGHQVQEEGGEDVSFGVVWDPSTGAISRFINYQAPTLVGEQTLDYTHSEAVAMNDSGAAIGHGYGAFKYVDPEADNEQALFGWAAALHWAPTPNRVGKVAYYNDGIMSTWDESCSLLDINNYGVLIGTQTHEDTTNYTTHNTLIAVGQGGIEVLPTLGVDLTVVKAINDLESAAIVGVEYDPATEEGFPVVWIKTANWLGWKKKYLGVYNTTTNENAKVRGGISDINDRMEMIGSFGPEEDISHLWRNGRLIDLDQYMKGWRVNSVIKINNQGVILASATQLVDDVPTGGEQFVLLAPTKVEILPPAITTSDDWQAPNKRWGAGSNIDTYTFVPYHPNGSAPTDLKLRLSLGGVYISEATKENINFQVAAYAQNERRNSYLEWRDFQVKSTDTISTDKGHVFVTLPAAQWANLLKGTQEDDPFELAIFDFVSSENGSFVDSDAFEDALTGGGYSTSVACRTAQTEGDPSIGNHNWSPYPLSIPGFGYMRPWQAPSYRNNLAHGGLKFLEATASKFIEGSRATVVDQADWIYYSGHGYSEFGSLACLMGNNAIHTDIHWDGDMELAIIAGCSILDVNDYNGNYDDDNADGDNDRKTGKEPGPNSKVHPGENWANTGPAYLLGYNYSAPRDDKQNTDGIINKWFDIVGSDYVNAWKLANQNSNGWNACAITENGYYYYHRTTHFGFYNTYEWLYVPKSAW